MKKILSLIIGILLVIPSIFLFTGCGCDYEGDYTYEEQENLSTYFDSNLPSGTVEFTNLILNTNDFERIIPLGQVSPPGHVFPTDHIYWVLIGIEKTVYAPTAGKILFISEPNSYEDYGIRVGVSNTMTYYLDHIFVKSELQVGDTISAGAEIGISGSTSCVDFGLINKNITNNFISTKYPVVSKYGDKPLSYYSEPLKTQLYALVKPGQPIDEPDYLYDGGVTDGIFVYDELGSLLGNWFKEGCFNSEGWYEWADTLSFCYDLFYTNQIRITLGNWGNTFAIKNDDNPSKPEDVSVTSGLVRYYLYNANNTNKGLPTGDCVGLMLVQMLSDSQIKLEIFTDTINASQQFTNSALFYVR